MHHAALELKEQFARVTVVLILSDGIIHTLLGEAVLQLKRDDRQAVDKQAHIQRKAGLVGRKLQLAGDAENILTKAFVCGGIVFRRSLVKKVKSRGIGVYSFAQYIHNAAFGDFTLDAIKEFLAAKFRIGPDFGKLVRLCALQKAKQAGHVHGMGAVVFGIAALFIATLVHKVTDYERFQTGFLDVGGHDYPCLRCAGGVGQVSSQP